MSSGNESRLTEEKRLVVRGALPSPARPPAPRANRSTVPPCYKRLMTTELRARFDAELSAVGLSLAGRDYELLFAMWAEHRPQREALRAAVPASDEEPDA